MVWKSTITAIAGLAVVLALAGQREARPPMVAANPSVLKPTGTTVPTKIGGTLLPNPALTAVQTATIMSQAGLSRYQVDRVYTMDWTNPFIVSVGSMGLDHPTSVNTVWGGLATLDGSSTLYVNVMTHANEVFLVDVNIAPIISLTQNGGGGNIAATVAGGGSKNFAVNQTLNHVTIPIQAPGTGGNIQLSYKGTLFSPAKMFVTGVVTVTTYK